MPDDTSKNRKKKLKKVRKGKSDVGKLLRSISSLRPIDELNVSNERLKSLTTKPSIGELLDDSEHDSDSLTKSTGSIRRPLSRNSGGDVSSLDYDSIGTEFSQSSRLTQRELIQQIEKRAKGNRPPPEYIQSLDQMHPSLVSWNSLPRLLPRSKTLPSTGIHSTPQINIIGCLHPVELILAKADERTRKRQKTLKRKQIRCEERVKEIDDAIQWKFTRAERYAAMLAAKQRQVLWIRRIIVLNYLMKLNTKFIVKLDILKEFRKVAKYAQILIRAFYRWYKKLIWKRVHYNYAHAFDQVEGLFRLHLRIYFKRRAVRRLKQFFTDYKGHHKMNLVVHKYLYSVKKVQSSMRDFLACKKAKIEAINKLWEKYEIQFIKKKLEQKRMKTQQYQMAKRSSDTTFNKEMEHKSFAEMKQQAVLWSRIDSKVESMVSQLRLTGVLVDEDEATVIQKLMLPLDVRYRAIESIIERVRKDYYVGQRTILKKRVEMDATFQEHHALALLRGQNENLNRIINEKFNKKLVNLKYNAFMLFRSLDRKLVWDKMKEAHALNETFKIKIDGAAPEKQKSIPREVFKEKDNK